MIKYNKLPENIEELLPAAIATLESCPDIIFTYIFGGLARGKPKPLSDVDIAVFLKRDADILKNKMHILGILVDCLHTEEIDLVILNSAPLSLKMRILKNKKIVIDKNPFVRHCYESLIMRQHFDFSVNEAKILRRRFLNG